MNSSTKLSNYTGIWDRYSQVIIAYLFLAVIMIIATILSDVFLSVNNLSNVLVASMPLIIASFAQTLCIITTGIPDLSVGAIVSLANVIAATVMGIGTFGYIPGLIVALLAGAGFGLINGIIVTKGRIQPIIVTLATSAVIGGVALVILPNPGGLVHPGFCQAITGDIYGIPVPLLVLIILTTGMWLLMRKTNFGRAILAIGGNEHSAYSSGILVDRIKIMTFVLSGLLSALAGIFLSARMYSGDPTVGEPVTMNTITATVLGGTALTGGKGTIMGTIAGAIIIKIINNVLNLYGISSFYQYIFQGLILITVLTFSSLRRKE